MRLSNLIAVVAVVLAGCTLTSGSGKGKLDPRWKLYVVDHVQPSAPKTLRSGQLEFRIEQVVVEEHRTVLGPSHWVSSVRGTILSTNGQPLLGDGLISGWTLVGKSGTTYSATGFINGPEWKHHEHTGQPTQLPPGTPGRFQVRAQVGDEKGHDDAAAVSHHSMTVPLN
jgi:hypothetical protein